MHRHSISKYLLFFLAAAMLLLASLAPLRAQASDAYPSKRITIIVPYYAGSPPDQYARLYAEKLRPLVGQSVIIENRPGAQTTVGTMMAARAKPDGYTLFYGSNSSLAAAPWVFKTLQYDPIKSFSAVAVTQDTPMIVIGKPADAQYGFNGMLERMKKEPGMHPLAGGALSQELIITTLQKRAGIEQPYARYNSGNLNNDIMGGRIAMAVNAMTGVASLIEDNKLHVFASTGLKPLPGKWSHVPTVAQTFPGFNITSWTGFWVPAGTPKPIIQYLNAKTHEILRDPDLVKRAQDGGALTLFMTPEESDAFVVTELERWGKMIKEAGIEPQ